MSNVTEQEAASLMERWLGEGSGAEGSLQAYNQTAPVYEEVVDVVEYRGPRNLAVYVDRLVKDRDVRILDIGAGTGLVGEELRKLGFSRMDALDPSQEMLSVAEKKNVYQRLIKAYLSHLPVADVEPETYDVIVGAGCMGENHLPSSAFIEIARMLKPGGKVILSTRDTHLQTCKDYVDNLEGILQKLKQEGKLEREESYNYPCHIGSHTGLILVFRRP